MRRNCGILSKIDEQEIYRILEPFEIINAKNTIMQCLILPKEVERLT